jgi:phage gp36-like protein
MARVTEAQLAAALGGSAVLVQLLDKNFDGAADRDLVEQAVEKAEIECNSAVQVAFDLDDPSVRDSPALEQHKLVIAVYWAYQLGTSGQAVPPHVRDAYQDTLAWLDRLAAGKRALGQSNHGRSSFGVEQVPIDPTSKRTTRRNMKAFC